MVSVSPLGLTSTHTLRRARAKLWPAMAGFWPERWALLSFSVSCGPLGPHLFRRNVAQGATFLRNVTLKEGRQSLPSLSVMLKEGG